MKSRLFQLFFLFILSMLFSNCTKENIVNNKVPIAEAGESQTINIEEKEATAILTGVGADSDGQVVAYEWSQISGPNPSIIVNEGASTTEVRQLTVGIYVFQLMVVDNDGATGVDTVSVTVKGPVEVTLSLQPSKNPNETVIWGNTTGLDQSGPNVGEIGAVSWTSGGIEIGMRTAITFDFSAIPATATIISAKLSLYSNLNPLNGDHVHANSGPDNSMYIQRNTTAWAASTAKWINQPSITTNNQVSIPHTTESFLDLLDIDVKKLVEDMVANGNDGFNIRLQNETIYNSRIFYSSKFNGNAQKLPKLVIVYSTN